MLLLALLAASEPVAADVTGMPPQIAIVREMAKEHDWAITCEGKSGEETVLRVMRSRRPKPSASLSVFGAPDSRVSSAKFHHVAETIPASCDQSPTADWGFRPPQVMAVGRRERLEKLESIARACGFARIHLRPRREGDLPPQTIAIPKQWVTLDAGEDPVHRYGPAICYVQLGRDHLSPEPGVVMP